MSFLAPYAPEPTPDGAAAMQDGLAALQGGLRTLEAQMGAGGGGRALLAAEETGGWDLGDVISVVWILCCAAPVFLMQAGFALVEAGTCRSKNVLSILVKNQVDFLAAGIAWFVAGWCIAFGDAAPTGGLLGTTQWFGGGIFDGEAVDAEKALNFHFQQMFCAVAATIVSGGIAERADLRGYILFSLFMCSCIYPFVACWCWNQDGWLQVRGFKDFAGSSVVHVTGGFGALVGAKILGPRIGRFCKVGVSRDSHEFAPHNVPFISLGTIILQFGWYAFNAGSTLSMNTEEDARTAVLAVINTTMAAVSGGVMSTTVRVMRKRRWDVPYVCNGVLAGCVAITAGCASVSPLAASCIGAVGGLVFCLASMILNHLHIDDPIGAFPVHGACGIWGTLAVALFHSGHDVLGQPTRGPDFLVQLGGVTSIAAFSSFMSAFAFAIVNHIGMLSHSTQEQRKGLDRKFSEEAYASGEVSRYRAFISHAKSTHGASARWLQLELAEYARGKSRIYLDSDNLVNLSHLLATVRDRVDVLVVLASEDIWWRPWCAGEIAVASSSDVPIVLVMMGEGDRALNLDFDDISQQVRQNMPPSALETLTPFGIGYDDIERAYSKLAAAPQVSFGLFSRKETRDALQKIARYAELRKADRTAQGSALTRRMKQLAFGQKSMARSITLRWGVHQEQPSCVILCDTSDGEAVAASHVCERALMLAGEQNASFRPASCAGMPEASVLRAVCAGATIVLVLSKKVLKCRLVQRACLVRAAALWPDGFAATSDAVQELAVLVDADHLGFKFPNTAFYEELLAEHPNLYRPERPGASGRNCLSMMPTLSQRERESNFSWGNIDFPYEDDTRAAVALSAFFRLLFQQIALPLSTHGSWKAIQQQTFWVYEKAMKIPSVFDFGKTRTWRSNRTGLSASDSQGMGRRPTILQSRGVERSKGSKGSRGLRGSSSTLAPRGSSSTLITQGSSSTPLSGHRTEPDEDMDREMEDSCLSDFARRRTIG